MQAVARAIKLARSGLAHPDQPVGAFLFAGPTGVGKTEVARQLAKVMGVEFLRFDMSEYMERHTVSRLIGAPPGYVGFDQGGLLTDAINKTPHCVLLLDEIEKAHPDLFNILLQVMDHATLTDNNGRKADFRNVILVMTTNAGAQELARAMIGFGTAAPAAVRRTSIERMFSPEFRNRLSAIIEFAPLSPWSSSAWSTSSWASCRSASTAQKVKLEVTADSAQVAGRTWLRSALRCAAAGAADRERNRAVARRRGAVRSPQEGRHRGGRPRRRQAQLRLQRSARSGARQRLVGAAFRRTRRTHRHI